MSTATAEPKVFNVDLDDELILHLPNPNAWKVLRDEGFSSDLLLDDFALKVYLWQDNHFREHGKLATAPVLCDQFELKLTEPETAIGYLIDCFRERYARNVGYESLERLAKEYKEDPTQLAKLLLREGAALSPHLSKRGSVNAANIQSTRLRWVWDNWITIGYLALVTGVSSIGKSLFACWLIAQITHGRLDGEFKGTPARVLLVTNEDGQGDMWNPRLEAADADLRYVDYLKYPNDWNVKDGISLIAGEVERLDSKLLYIDCTLEHMPMASSGEIYSAPFIRQSLAPLKELIRSRGIGGVISLHPPKAKGASFSEWVAGSGAWVQATRTGLLFGEHPEDHLLLPQERRRVIISPAESRNVGKDVGSLEFEIKTIPLKIEDVVTEQPRITEPNVSSVSIEEMMKPKKDKKAQTKKDKIRELIDARLDDGKWHHAMTEELEGEGYGTSTIDKAAANYVESIKRGKLWYWAKDGSASDTFEESEVSK
jgi:hypothetical protein